MRKPWRYYRNGWLKRVAAMEPIQTHIGYYEDYSVCVFCGRDSDSRHTIEHELDCLWLEIRREMPGAKG